MIGIAVDGRRADYIEMMRSESDRGAVLLGAAFIDEVLEKLLLRSFVDEAKTARRLLQYPGPCSTASSRCDLALCMGLIGKDVYNDIRTIIGIRNKFAHTREPASFATQDIAEKCRNTGVMKAMADGGADFGQTSTRSLFLITAGALISKLECACTEAVHGAPGPCLKDMKQMDANPMGY